MDASKFKRAFNKVTKPFTKVAQKLMPKELAGIAQWQHRLLVLGIGALYWQQVKQNKKVELIH